jgi:predicted DNA-binding transcriptional regulator AlpA
MSDDHSTYRTTQPGSSDDPAINSPDGMDQPGAPPREQPPTDRLIGIKEIRQLFGLGRTAAYDLTHRPGFPSPMPVSRNAYRWWASEVAAFTAALRVESQHSSSPPPTPDTAAHVAPGGGASAHYGQGARRPQPEDSAMSRELMQRARRPKPG